MKIFDENGNIISDCLIDQSMVFVDHLLLFITQKFLVDLLRLSI